MPQMKVNVGHNLDPDEAARRLRAFLELIKQNYGDQVSQLEESWGDRSGTFSFRAMGFKTSGSVEVDQNEVRVTGQLPLAAVMFRGKVEAVLRQQLNRALGQDLA